MSRRDHSASQEGPRIHLPQRQRSVRFHNVGEPQLDGPGSEHPRRGALHAAGSQESDGSKNSHKILERMEAFASKFDETAPNTVVHRSKARLRPFTPFINTALERFPDFGQNMNAFNPSSSSASGRDAN